jgi:sugar phosphate isomerase/epimerase
MPRPICERLAFSTNAFKRSSLSEATRVIAETGYAGCELMADHPHMTPAAMTQSQVQAMADNISAAGLRVSNVNAFTGFFAAGDEPSGDTYHPTWIEENEAARQTRIAHTCACIRLAVALGAKTVSLQPGGPLIGTNLGRDAAGVRFADGIRELLPVAREARVTLAVEPEPGLFLQTTAEYRQWKQEFFADEPLVKMNFDVGHAFCVGEDPAVVASEMAGEYAHIHLEDIAASRVHQHLAPGEGAIDFRALFSALDEVDYGGWITVELYPFLDDAAGAARRAMKHLRTLLK